MLITHNIKIGYAEELNDIQVEKHCSRSLCLLETSKILGALIQATPEWHLDSDKCINTASLPASCPLASDSHCLLFLSSCVIIQYFMEDQSLYTQYLETARTLHTAAL